MTISQESFEIVGPSDQAERDAYLAQFKPSSRSSAGPWYWAYSGNGSTTKIVVDDIEDVVRRTAFESQGEMLKLALVQECERIKKEEPVRSNKAKRTRSQKEWRDEAYAKFRKEVAALAKEYDILSGKWLLFPTAEYVDSTWAKIVHSLTSPDGALHNLPFVNTAKVAQAPSDSSGDRETWVLCIYVNDSWDKETVGKAFRVLIEELQLNPLSYKCDAFTLLGIDSKHPSKIPSSLYTQKDMHEYISKEEIEVALKKRLETLTANARAVQKKSREEEEAEIRGGDDDGFDPVSSDDEAPPPAKKKKA